MRKFSKFIVGLGLAMDEAAEGKINKKQQERTFRRVGHTLASDQNNRSVRLAVIREESDNVSASLWARSNEHIARLGAQLSGLCVVIDSFENGTYALDRDRLAKLCSRALADPGGGDILLRIIGSSLSSDTIESFREIPYLQQRIATLASQLETDERKEARLLSHKLQAALHVLAAFKAATLQKFCSWCSVRMREYWTLTMKPWTDKENKAHRPRNHYKVCGTCKNDPVLMEGFDIEGTEPRSFT